MSSPTKNRAYVLRGGMVRSSSAGAGHTDAHRHSTSFCEACQKLKPRKGKTAKGWKCDDCRKGRFALRSV